MYYVSYPWSYVLKITCCEGIFHRQVLIFKGSKSLILNFQNGINIRSISLRTGARSDLKAFSKIIPDINIIWHQFVEYSLKGGPGQWSRYSFPTPIRVMGLGISFSYFLQIYKLRGSYIKECKNYFRNSKNYRKFCFLGVSCMICSGWNRLIWTVQDSRIGPQES